MEESEVFDGDCVILQIFICELCDLKFANQNDLDRHNQLHAGTGGFSCPLCKAILPDMHQLQLHDLQHSLTESQGNVDNLADFDVFAQPSYENICIMCGDSFEKEEDLLMHCTLHAEDNVATDVQAVDPDDEHSYMRPVQLFEAGIRVAKKSFPRPVVPKLPEFFTVEKGIFSENYYKSSVQRYLTSNEPYYPTKFEDDLDDPLPRRKRSRMKKGFPGKGNKCDQCKKIFSNYFSLKRHKSIINMNKRPYSCIFCQKTFLQMRMLLRHTAHHHKPNEDFYACEHCKIPFCELEAFHHHLRDDHDMQYNCEACFLFFKEKEEYDSHMSRHTTTYGFDCCRCHKRYKDQRELDQHKCSQENIRDYQCKVCKKRFHRKYHLLRHFSVHQLLTGKVLKDDRLNYAVKIERDSDGFEVECEEPVFLKRRNRNRVPQEKYDNIVHYRNGRRTMYRKPMVFRCYICNVKWPNLRRYKQHFIMAHAGVKFNACHICGKQFTTAFRVRRHLSCHGIPECIRETAIDLKNLERQEDSDDMSHEFTLDLKSDGEDNLARGKRYKCYICKQQCDNLRRFKLHFKSHHKNIEFNSCHICLKTFPNTYKVQHHVVSHYVQVRKELESKTAYKEGESDMDISIPQEKVDMLAELKDVSTNGRGVPKTYTCYVCNKNCQTYILYKCHFFSEHKDVELNACHICKKKFTTTTKARRHVLTHMDKRMYRCHTCEKKFVQFSHLKRHRALMHVARSERLSKCMYCPKLYADKLSFEKHLLEHQLAEKSDFKCTVCDEKFVEERLLDEHILAFHDFFKKFQCSVCKRRFHKESYLNRHMITHTGLRKWKCFKCNKRFTAKSDLNRHALTHTNAKPFRCSFCDKSFTRSAYREKHTSMFHNDKHVAADKNRNVKPSLKNSQSPALVTLD